MAQTLRYIADTNILVSHIRQRRSPTLFDAAVLLYGFPEVSDITIYELEVGAVAAGRANDFETLFPPMKTIAFSHDILRKAASLEVALRRDNNRIGLADTLIAATALVHKMKVLTLNRDHFERVPDLHLLDIPDR